MCFAYELIVNSLIAFPCSAPGGTAQWDKNDKIVNGTMGLESEKIKLNLLKNFEKCCSFHNSIFTIFFFKFQLPMEHTSVLLVMMNVSVAKVSSTCPSLTRRFFL